MAGEIVIRISVPDGAVADVDYGEEQRPEPIVQAAIDAARSVFGDEVAQDAPRDIPVLAAQRAYEQANPSPVLKREVGPGPISQTRPEPIIQANGVPDCPAHGQMRYFPSGTSDKTGKTFNASYRCPERDCPTRPVWGVK